MSTQWSRTELLIGKEGTEILSRSRVLVMGLGGVGGSVAEALARAGVGTIGVCDGDTVSITNLNRQILATHDTVGQLKTTAAQARIYSIHPFANVIPYPFFYNKETFCRIELSAYDFIVDAIDQVSAKIALIERAKVSNTPIVCSMGTGNKLDPSRFRVADIHSTAICPLAKTMRGELKRRGITDVAVVYSDEPPAIRLQPPASLPFVPPVAGMILAGHVIKNLLRNS